MDDRLSAGAVDSSGGSLADASPPLPGFPATSDDLVPPDVSPSSAMGVFSARRFFAARPETYREIARAQLEGLSDAACARVFAVHQRTAAAIRAREQLSTGSETYRRAQAVRLRSLSISAVETLADRIAEDPASVPARDLAAIVRVAHEAERALAGAPASIVGVVRPDGASARLAALLDAAVVEPTGYVGDNRAVVRELVAPPARPDIDMLSESDVSDAPDILDIPPVDTSGDTSGEP